MSYKLVCPCGWESNHNTLAEAIYRIKNPNLEKWGIEHYDPGQQIFKNEELICQMAKV